MSLTAAELDIARMLAALITTLADAETENPGEIIPKSVLFLGLETAYGINVHSFEKLLATLRGKSFIVYSSTQVRITDLGMKFAQTIVDAMNETGDPELN